MTTPSTYASRLRVGQSNVGAQQQRQAFYANRQRSQAGRRPPNRTPGPNRQQRAPQQAPQRPKQFVPENILNAEVGEIFCKVRKVMSGDQLRLEYAEREGNGKPIEFMLILDYIRAPRISRSPNDPTEEQSGFEAREYLRKLLIGSVVRCVYYKKDAPKGEHFTKRKDLYDTLNPSKKEPTRLQMVFGSLKCLRNNPKQRYNEQVYRDPNNWVDVAELLVRQGFAECKRLRVEEQQKNTYWQRLNELQQEAQNARVGKYKPCPANFTLKEHIVSSTRHVEWNPNEQEIAQFVKDFKGKWIDGIIEDVRDGSMVRVEVLLQNDGKRIETVMIWLCLSGIQCLRMPKPVKTQLAEWENQKQRAKMRGNPGPQGDFKPIPVPPLAEKAKMFVARRLLHQDVKIKVEQLDIPNQRIFGQVQFEKHDISAYLLRQGLAQTQEYHMPAECKDKYFKEEAMAKQQHKGLWADKSSQKQRAPKRAGEAWVVAQVSNADCITLRSTDNRVKARRCYLAHIRAQRFGNKLSEDPEKVRDDPYAWEAKEFVRERLMTGKEVQVRVIYERPPRDKKDKPLEFITLKYESDNGQVHDISEQLIAAGLAKIMGSANMDKAPNYFKLIELQEQAKAEGNKGIYLTSKYTPPTFVDLTLGPRINPQKRDQIAQNNLSTANSFMREMGLEANILRPRERGFREKPKMETRSTSVKERVVIEYVFGSTRMKARLVKYNKIVIFLLAGVQGFRGNNLNATEQKCSEEGTKYVRELVQQRDGVSIEIETLDKNCNFAGYLFVKVPGKGLVNVGEELLKKGYAKIFEPSVAKSRHGNKLRDAESFAEENNLGVWEHYVRAVENKGDPTLKAVKQQERPPHPLQNKKKAASIIWAESAVDFYINFNDEEERKKIAEVQKYMDTVNPRNNPAYEGWNPLKYDYVACLFNDGKYYRAQIVSIRKKRDDKYLVNFIDFGNKESAKQAQLLPLQRVKDKRLDPVCLRILPTEKNGIEALARKCKLAGCKPPPEKNQTYCNAGTQAFASMILSGGKFQVEILKVLGKTNREQYEVTLTNGDQNINETMLSGGYCRVDEMNRAMWGGRDTPNAYPELLDKMKTLQKSAITKHRGMYEYGLVETDDED